MDSLSDVRTSMTMTMSHQNSAINQKINALTDTTSNSMNAMAKLKKLEPQRMGGWSWDGLSNKTAKKKEKLQHFSTSTTNKTAARIIEVASTNNTVIQSLKDCILFHVILWLPYCASDIRIEIEYRERFHILIQCAVCTLWRSRIASEDSHEKKVTGFKNDESNPLNRTAGKNEIPNDDSSRNDVLSQSKKRKFKNDEKTEMAPKNLVQPTLSLVFVDGSTASITQEQLTLSMARKRMAAPTEYQVLSSIIELLNDPILQLIQKIPKILPKNYPDTVKVNGLSSSKNGSEKKEESSGSEVRERINENNDLEDGLWIQSLHSLLPKSLNRKQRKKIHIIDINDLLSSTTREVKDIKKDEDVNYTGMSRNEKDSVIYKHGENLLPSLSSIVYGFQDTSALPGLSKDASQSNEGKDQIKDEDEEIPSQVLVLLRPAVHYLSKTMNKQNQNLTAKSPFSSSKATVFNSKIAKSLDQSSASSKSSDNMDFYTKSDQKRYSEIEKTELNKMLNEYMYGKNSKKYDITAKSVLYCTASLFSSISNIQPSVLSTSDNTSPQTVKGQSKSIHHTHIIQSNHANTNKGDALENTKSKLKYVSPGIAVCVLQHWAYHKKLLPTLQTAQKNYLRIVS